MRLVHWLVTLPVTVVAIVFALSNRQPVEVDFWPLPLAIGTRVFLIVLGALALGFVIGEIVAWNGGRHWRREARQRAQRIALLERELAATQLQLKSGPAAAGRALSPTDTRAR